MYACHFKQSCRPGTEVHGHKEGDKFSLRITLVIRDLSQLLLSQKVEDIMIIRSLTVWCDCCGVVLLFVGPERTAQAINKALVERYGWALHDEKHVCPNCVAKGCTDAE